MPPQNERPPSRLLVLGTVSFYLFAAIAMILANKWVLNKTTIPIFFLLVQLAIAVLLLALSHFVGIIRLSLSLDPTTVKALAPLVAINVLGLNFNNLTLKYVDASFYQVARGLLLPITVGFSSVLLHSRPSFRILLSCAVVTMGFFIGILIDTPSTAYFGRGSSATGAKPPSLLGVAFGLLSSVSTALHAVVIKRSLDAVNGSTLQLAWYSNLLSSLVMMPLVVLSGELPGVANLFFGDAGASQEGEFSPLATFLWGSAITGFVGFLICIAGFLSIKITSPITHMVSAAVRGVLQTLFSVAFFGDVITTGRASSITTILIGSIYYTWVKNDETVAAQRKFSDALPTQMPPRSADEEQASKLESGVYSRRRSTSGDNAHQNGGAYEPVPLREFHGRPSSAGSQEGKEARG